ncbi:MAG: tRNA (N6-threonylcarbamoyladenosine(37)-N6)-methyltransferase TrmO [Planctomycetota bacterium]|jgi:tRNA-Thr(GGU) m(6)t(6)A37 methyltransferase TsaA
MGVSRRDFFSISTGAGLTACGVLGAIGARPASAGPERQDYSKTVYEMSPVGRIHNKKGGPVRLEIFEKYVPALHGLEHCSHVMVVWWFHKNDTPKKRAIFKVHPRGNKKNLLTGVFATHAPVRPNLIALTTCKVLSVQGGIVTVDKIDAFDDTPILDLKSAGTRKESLAEKE